MAIARKPIPSLRWWIGGLLFASTVINYIDRQTLSLLAPYLKLEYHWTNSDYANIAMRSGSHIPLGRRASASSWIALAPGAAFRSR
jgi:ACS family hexuronate transporter-like MFS transporter